MKKLLSFILALIIFTGLSAFFVNAEESTDYIFIPAAQGDVGAVTYGFENPEYWEDVYVYATGGRSEEYGDAMTWPGVKLELEYVDDYGYLYTFSFATGYYDTLLFNDGTKNNYRADLEKDFYDYCVEELGEDSLYEGAKVSITDTLKLYDGKVLFTATSWEEPVDAPCNEIVEYCCVHRNATFSPYGLGVYVSSGGVIYTLEEAFERSIINGIPNDNGFTGFEFHRVYEENMDLDLMHKCLYAFGDRYGYKPQEGESIYCEPYGYVGENVIFQAYYSHYDYLDIVVEEQIGDYYFYNGFPCGQDKNNSVALYVLTPDNKVYTLYEAYTQSIVKDLDAVAKLAGGKSIYGDYGNRICELLGIDTEAEDCKHLYREIRTFSECGNAYGEAEGVTPEIVVVEAGESTTDEAPCINRIGKYAVANEQTYAPYGLGYFVYFPYEDKLYTLEEAYEAYPYYADIMISLIDYPSTGYYRLIGNVDYDNRITIKDATRIQKRIAGCDLGEVYREELELEASDFNGDGKLNIRDATAIQKMLAHIE